MHASPSPAVAREPSALRRSAAALLCVAIAAGVAPAQILTTDAGVRSPELPSVRVLSMARRYDAFDDVMMRVEAVHSPTPRFELEAAVPLVRRRLDGGEELRGLGDASLRAKLALVRDDGVMRSDRVSLLARVVLPTGEADAVVAGQKLAPRLQLGLGSFGVGLGAAATVVRDRHRASLACEWLRRGDHDGFDPGDQIACDAAWWYRVSPAAFDPLRPEPEWRFVAELHALYGFRDRGARSQPSDDGLLVDALAGLQVNVGTALRVEFGVLTPLVRDLQRPNGKPGLGLVLGATFYF
ncbi:MAG: hypothetical protein KAI24_13140 [Planctomycetes bacterium]|nr:hypothetical protein [Planctomycetota bacterium]